MWTAEWFSYIHNFIIIILSRVYKEPVFQLPAPSWLVSLIGRALDRYRRGQGFESCTSLNFFRLSFRNCKRCVYNCDDILSYHSSLHSSHIWFSYIHNFNIKQYYLLGIHYIPSSPHFRLLLTSPFWLSNVQSLASVSSDLRFASILGSFSLLP